MNELIPLAILRGATALIGTIFIIHTLKAYRKYRNRSLLVLALAVGLMVTGVLVEAVAFFGYGASLGLAETLEASVVLLAFLVLLWSVRAKSE